MRSIESLALCLLAGAALAGCGGGATAPATTSAAAGTTTTGGGATSTGTVTAPMVPAAVVSWAGGGVAMASYGGCWRGDASGPTVCADPAPASCPDAGGRIPGVRVAVGTVLRFRLRVPAPSALRLETDHGASEPLPARTEVTWRAATPSGPLILRAQVPGHGDAAWVACLSLT